MQKALAFRKRKMHYLHMPTHSDILKSTEAVSKVVEVTGRSIHTVRSWRQRNSIPAEYWGAVVDAGLASLDELAGSVDFRAAQAAA